MQINMISYQYSLQLIHILLISFMSNQTMQEEQKQKYLSILNQVNLPQTRHLIQGHQNLFTFPDNNADRAYVTKDIKDSLHHLIERIEAKLQIFENTNYNFIFPQSKFPDVPKGQRNQITYEQKMLAFQQDTFKDKLSEQQIHQIGQRGQFQVNSSMKNVTIPYVWKINDYLLRGHQNIVHVWQNGLAWCYGILYSAVYIVKQTVPRKIKNLSSIPGQFFALVFGKRSLRQVYSPNFDEEIQLDFWTDIFQNQLKDINKQIGFQYLQLLYLPYEPAIYKNIKKQKEMSQSQYKQLVRIQGEKVSDYNTKNNKINEFKYKLNEIDTKFEQNWVKIRRKIITKISNQIQSRPVAQISNNEEDPLKLQNDKEVQRDEAIVQKFLQQKYLLYSAHIKTSLQKLSMSTKVIQALVTLITIINVVSAKLKQKQNKLQKLKQKISQDIDKKYKIRSKNSKFRNDRVSAAYTPISEEIQTQFYNNFIKDQQVAALINPTFLNIYKKYINFRTNYDKIKCSKKKTTKLLYVPERVFRTTFLLTPPYEVIYSNGCHYLKRQKQMSVDTSTNFWKFKLYLMRLKSWTINCAIFLVGFSWVGPFGLKCLFGVSDFRYDQYCNIQTGQKNYYTRKTFIGQFLQVVKGIKKSRQYFESLPDRGLFGKKFSRIFNYFQCYVFRLVFVGIVGVLLLYPIAICVLSLLCLVLTITVWIWVPLIMLICYLFNVLIFQFQNSDIYHRGILISGVPLLSLAFRIISTLVQIIFAILNLIVFSPLVSLLYTIYLVVQRAFRTFTDKIMLFIIKHLGRTPSRDTAIARKISGPGMSRNYFYSINQEDVYILTQSALQKKYINKFSTLTRNKINSHTQKYNQITEYVLTPFGYSKPNLRYGYDIVLQNKNDLMKTFEQKYNHYMARFPNDPRNIRFTEEEIDQYFDNCIKIVKNFIQRQKIHNWIFQQNNVLYQDYDELTRNLWIQIFGVGEEIFQTLETIDSRFKISEQITSNTLKMRQNVSSVMKALEGQVSLSHRQASFNPARRTLHEKDQSLAIITALNNIHTENSQLKILLNLQNPSYLLVPPRNLQSIKNYHHYFKDQIKEAEPILFEE